MAEKNDSGIDRRKVLKSIGAASALTGAVGMGSKRTRASPPDGPCERDPLEDCEDRGDPDRFYRPFAPDWTAFPDDWEPDADHSMFNELHFLEPADVAHGYQIMEETNSRVSPAREPTHNEPHENERAWESSGPSSGDKVFVWAHGWQQAGGRSPEEALREGWKQGLHAWHGINYYTNVMDDADHTIAFAWNSASSGAGFDNAVEQAHNQGPGNYAPFLLDLADRISPGGTLHIGAHSLGCWMTLEALGAAYYDDRYWNYHGLYNDSLYDVLESVRFISAAVPESALGHNGGDVDWVGCTDSGTGYCNGDYVHANFTYDEHALKIPNKIINGYFLCDEIVDRYGHECDICDHVDPQAIGPFDFSPFQTYLANWGSSSSAVGANPVKVGDEIDKSKWVNRPIRGGRMHTGVYKHPDYITLDSRDSRTGYGQDDLWVEWNSKDAVRVNESDVGSVDDVDVLCLTDAGPRITDRMAAAIGLDLEEYIERPKDGGDVVEMTAEVVESIESGGSDGGGGGGGGGDDELVRIQ